MKEFEKAELCEDCYFFHYFEDIEGYKIGLCALWSRPKRPLYTDAYSTCDDCMKEKKKGGQYTATTAPHEQRTDGVKNG